MKHLINRYYLEDKQNCHCFFQPASDDSSYRVEPILTVGISDSLPTPMDKHRVPVLRLVPRGYK